MSFVEALAERILQRAEFKDELADLERASFATDLPPVQSSTEGLRAPPSAIRRLLQAATVFATSERDAHQAMAQRISTAALRLSPGDRAVNEVFAVVQGRLRNFPAITNAAGASAPESAPGSMQLEFVSARESQTVEVAGRQHVLTSFQSKTWQALNHAPAVTVSAPTSAGKSYVVMLHLVDAYLRKKLRDAVYLVPTRALINQVSEDAAAEFASRGLTGVEIITVPVDMGDAPKAGSLYVLTQERLDALLVSNPSKTFELAIVDEAQVIADGARGVLLESVIERLKANNPATQFVFLGPLISNPAYFKGLIGTPSGIETTTSISPVTQRVIQIDYFADPISTAVAYVGERHNSARVEIDIPAKLRTDLDRLSYLSSYFGRAGSSIVYANGKADSEKAALKIADLLLEAESAKSDDSDSKKDLDELIKLAKKHVHPDYALATTLKAGVGFHYGHMPSLLRKELERLFKERKIRFMVCTSTLLYGLNLPAKNIFLQKPTTGEDQPIGSASFWNLAGRVGRLGKELEGQVFLIDYPEWPSKPAEGARGVVVTSALGRAVGEKAEELLAYLEDEQIPSGRDGESEVVLANWSSIIARAVWSAYLVGIAI